MVEAGLCGLKRGRTSGNLDLGSVAQLVGALRAYRGAFVVVSHDRFLADLDITRHLHLAEGRLHEVAVGHSGLPQGT